MPEMPIPYDYNPNVPKDEESESIFELMDEESNDNIEEMPDGSAVVYDENFKTPEETPDFYENLAEVVDEYDTDNIAFKFIKLIEKDKDAREDRDKKYEEGLRRTGLGDDAPGGAQFMGASKVVHPVMAEACVDFCARAIKELFPPEGPVRSNIIGEVTEEKQQRADRKKDFMNWQLTEQIVEFRSEEEQMLTQLPMGGSQFIKMWFDEKKRVPCTEFIPIDYIYLPYSATNFYTAMRVTEVQILTHEEYDLRVEQGLYRDLNVYRVSNEPEKTKAEKANDRIEGRTDNNENVDGLRTVYVVYTWLELQDDKYTKGERAPYIMMLDKDENAMIGLYRNWENGDETFTKLDWIVEYEFIPWRGAYAIGLPNLIGGLSAALTGSLRALLDSAHIDNSPTMLKLKGGKISGQSQQIDVTQVTEIEGAPGVDDIRKVAMPLPFKGPNQVLFALLGWLDNAAKGVITTTEEKIADITSNAPVGTTQALIEQGSAVYSSIHARLHNSQKRLLKILARINRWYLDEQIKGEIVHDLEISKEDFKTNSDIIPVSDPHIFSETQRFAQIQALTQRAQANPDLYNRLAVEKRVLKQLKIPNVNEILPDPHEVKDMNPMLENASMTLGKPVGAFIGQNHVAHIMSHIQYASDPVLGGNPIIAPTLVPNLLEHIKQHLVLWYLNHTEALASASQGKPFGALKVQPIAFEMQEMLAGIGQMVHQESQQTLGQQVLPFIQQMLQTLQKMSGNQQPTDPNIMAQVKALTDTAMAETQRKAELDKAEIQLKAQKQEQDLRENHDKLIAQQQIEGAKLDHDTTRLQIENEFASQQRIAEQNKELQQQQMQQVANAQKANQQAQAQGFMQEGVSQQLQQGGQNAEEGT